jgi:transcriptional regulator with XRE-family HTH domain
MTASTDHASFSTRLRALLLAVSDSDRPLVLAREFNRRFAGAPVTVYAARKWLLGEAIPTQSKLRALARWLGVSPEWLRYGEFDAADRAPRARAPRLQGEDLGVLADLHKLGEHERRLARDFVRLLARLQGRASPEPAASGAIVRHAQNAPRQFAATRPHRGHHDETAP